MNRREIAAALDRASARLKTASGEVDRGDVAAAKEEIKQAVADVRAVVKELDAR